MFNFFVAQNILYNHRCVTHELAFQHPLDQRYSARRPPICGPRTVISSVCVLVGSTRIPIGTFLHANDTQTAC